MVHYAKLSNNVQGGTMSQHAQVPMQQIGPVQIIGPEVNEQIYVPLATYESPLWPSTNRGAKVSRSCAGIHCTVIDDRMTRSVLLQGNTALDCHQAWLDIEARFKELQQVVAKSSRFATLVEIHRQLVGNLLFIRFEFSTGDASGHNMATKSSDQLMAWILKNYPQLEYLSISGNFCTDKKASCVNGILGRGKYVIAEAMIPRQVVKEVLKTTPEKIIELNIKKNLIGTQVAGTIRSANAHFANMLLGFYLATGQDAANIIEGSQGFVHAELKQDHLYFSTTLPNIIVGTIGNGKDLDFVQENLRKMGCLESREPGANGRRLAIIAAATVFCGEISLMAAQTNPGELMRAHVQFERKQPAAESTT